MKKYRYRFKVWGCIIPITVTGFNELNAWYIAVHILDSYFKEQFKTSVWGLDEYVETGEKCWEIIN